MSVKCLRCDVSFDSQEAKKLHFIEDARETTYDLNMQEHVYGCRVRCMNYREMFLYYDRNEQKEYCLKKGAALRLKTDRAYIAKEELENILAPFDLKASDVIRKLPDVSIRGNRSMPQGIEKRKALEIARKLWFEA
jgi:hypothetical protein